MGADNIRVRRACLGDYDGVMDINRHVYDDFDYLPYMYHIFLQDKRCHAVLAELDGEIVGLSIWYILDNGQRAVRVAGRSKENLQGQGIMTKMSAELQKFCLIKYPNLRLTTWTSADVDYYQTLAQKPELSISIPRTWSFLPYKIPQTTLARLNLQSAHLRQLADVITPSHDDVRRLLSDPAVLKDIFKDSSYIEAFYNWLPLTCSVDNVLKIAKSSVVMATLSGSGKLRKCQVLSHSVISKISFGIQCRVYVCHAGSKVETIGAHLLHHCARASRVAPPSDNVGIVAALPTDIDREDLVKLVKPFLGDPMPNSPTHGGVMVQPIHQAKL